MPCKYRINNGMIRVTQIKKCQREKTKKILRKNETKTRSETKINKLHDVGGLKQNKSKINNICSFMSI